MREKPIKTLTALLLLVALFSACGPKHDGHADHGDGMTYTCPMHPEVVSGQPGQCPICHMDLVPASDVVLEEIALLKDKVISRQATVMLYIGRTDTITAQGYIDFDKTRNQSVSARFGGRVERLYIRYSLQYVSKGDKIMDLYSPSLSTVQEEHLLLLRTGASPSLIENSKQKLRLLGLTPKQILQLEQSGEVALTVSIFSPSSGYVFFENTPVSNNSPTQDGASSAMSMGGKDNQEEGFASTIGQIREGMYISEGQVLFNVNDLKQVWAVVSIPTEYIANVSEKQPLEIVSESFPNQPITGAISLVELTFEENAQRFARARVSLPNPELKLKINSLVTARIAIGAAGDNLTVPSSAVFNTGLNSYVWVKTDTTKAGAGVFELRKVVSGAAHNGMTTIVGGLQQDEEIATQAGMMTDSETFLNID